MRNGKIKKNIYFVMIWIQPSNFAGLKTIFHLWKWKGSVWKVALPLALWLKMVVCCLFNCNWKKNGFISIFHVSSWYNLKWIICLEVYSLTFGIRISTIRRLCSVFPLTNSTWSCRDIDIFLMFLLNWIFYLIFSFDLTYHTILNDLQGYFLKYFLS